MAGLWILPAIMSVLLMLTKGDDSFEPMVAFICEKPAMYSTERGHSWIKDDSTGCLKDPVDILNYCRKVFPTLDVHNVVEGSEKVTVSNWCDFGMSFCDKEFTVTPYRCLVGAFQSDALLVPEHCVFDHIHDSKLCTSFSEWNKTSMQSCIDRGMVQQSFAMLQPCGIDKFNGVEFVCCPTKQVIEKGKDREIVVTSRKQQQSAAARQQQPAVLSAPIPVVNKAQQPVKTVPAAQRQQQQQQQGDKKRDHQWNEHEYYMKAKTDMQKHHHDKIAKMMKDWAAARQRVQEMRARDPKQSEKLNREITNRFQKMYESEELESDMEKKQLSLLHQQRVQAEIKEKKEKALDDYVQTLNEYNSDAGAILRSLKRYIKTLHKDRMHTINHYQHLEDTDPDEADRVRQATAENLRRVDQLLTDALSMLNRVPKLKNKIMQQIQDYLDAYHLMDRDAALILLAQSTTKEAKKSEDDDDDDDDVEDIVYDEGDDEDDDDEWEVKKEMEKEEDSSSSSKSKEVKKNQNKESKDDDSSDDDDDDDEDDDNDDDDDDNDDDDDEKDNEFDDEDDSSFDDEADKPIIPSSTRAPIPTETTRQPTTKSAAPVELKSGFGSGMESHDSAEKKERKVEKQERLEDKDKKTEQKKDDKKLEDVDETLTDMDYFHLKGSTGDRHAAAANIDKDLFSVNQAYIKQSPLHSPDSSSFNAAVPLGLAVAGLTVFVVIVVGVVLMRRRQSHRRPLRRLGSLDHDRSVDMGAISPEERHVASMQMNGYENPTYKYFEQQNVSA